MGKAHKTRVTVDGALEASTHEAPMASPATWWSSTKQRLQRLYVRLPAGLRQAATPGRGATLYVAFALTALLITTIVWSLLGAQVMLDNADQLVNAYLFENGATFHGATMPGQHSFFFKWPLFWAIKIAGLSATAFTVGTVLTVLTTVGLLVWLLYKIARRPLLFGTLCLALASVLLLIPAQPYTGGMLPVNMAMLTTRNLEYLLYIGGLVLFIRAPRVKSWQFWAAVGVTSLLIASDKLFMTLGVGAALLALFVYALARRWEYASFAVTWGLGELLASLGGTIIIGIINASKVTHIASQAAAGPYGLAGNVHDVITGSIYALLGLASNLGASPVTDPRIVREIPGQVLSHVLAPSTIAAIINVAVLLAGIAAALVLSRASLGLGRQTTDGYQPEPAAAAPKLAIMLIWTTVVALAAFIASSHYYAGDARYLAVALFAVFVCLATVARRLIIPAKKLLIVGLLFTLMLPVGMAAAVHNYQADKTASRTIVERNKLITTILAQRRLNLLVGDYWRVVPTKLQAVGKGLTVVPLGDCTQARDVLSSSTWQPDLRQHGFAYLLSYDQKFTDYPQCSLEQIVTAFGKPNASTVIAGTPSSPKELLLLYDHGRGHSGPKVPTTAQSPSTVVPIPLDELPHPTCVVPTVVNIVAHQDDDLLFMNPDILRDIKAGRCVRTIYVTAGDAGAGPFYWLGRQKGSEAAYTRMLGGSDVWIQRIVQLPNKQYVTIANPRGNASVSLVFVNLPDGNLHGQGFNQSHHQSIARLDAGEVAALTTVDGQSAYTATGLVDALTALLQTYQPSEIRTQSNYVGTQYPDHSDHMAVGRFAKRAHDAYEARQFAGMVAIPIHYYIGYPIHEMPENVSGAELTEKADAFAAYTQYDDAVCMTLRPCRFEPVLQIYLRREYQHDN